MNNKERVTRLVVATAMVGSSAFFSACGTSKEYRTTENPAITRDYQNPEWNQLPAKNRLYKLVTKDYPVILGFDPQREITLATAEEYSSQTGKGSASDMARSVKFADDHEFISELSEELKISFSETEAEKEMKSRLAITTSTGNIIINQNLMSLISDDLARSGQIDKFDPKSIVEISTLVHELTHKEKRVNVVSFKAFSLRLPNNPDLINFDTLNGFKIEGEDSQGKKMYLLGGDEAITDLAASIIVKKMGFPYASTPEYKNGAMLVKSLNGIANISDEDFLKYVLGDFGQSQLIEKWGSHRTGGLIADSNLKTGSLTLAEIALATQGLVKFQEVERDIRENFK